uniref:Uncharacterized protein n=1 Tax=Lygus hesperus TaxID=30085 RepID=A0A0K8SUK3_LYGHE
MAAPPPHTGVVGDLPAVAGVQGPALDRGVARERGRTPGPGLTLDLTPRAREDAPTPRAAPVKDLVQDKMFKAHRICATPNTFFLHEEPGEMNVGERRYKG